MTHRPPRHACEAWHLLVRFSLAQRAHRPSVAAELELSPAQVQLLRLLEPGRPVVMGRLAAALCCDASNVTGLVDRLEARGLIARETSASDRRVKVVGLTAEGARIRARLLDSETSAPPAFSRLSLNEQRTLLRLLERLVAD